MPFTKLLDKGQANKFIMKDLEKFTDEELIKLAKENNAHAVEVLLIRYAKITKNIAHTYFLRGGDMDDLYSAGNIATHKAIFTYNGKAKFSTYVYTCVQNAIFSVIRQSKSQKNKPLYDYISISGQDEDSDPDKTGILIDTAFGPEDKMVQKERLKELTVLIKEKLSKYEFNILKLYVNGYSLPEIASKCKKEYKSVENAMHRIRKKIRAII